MPKCVIFWIIITILLCERSAIVTKSESFNFDVEILSELISYELIIFSSNISPLNSDFYRNMILQVPTVSIDLTRITASEINEMSTLPRLRNPTSSTAYVLFATGVGSESVLNDIKNTLGVITQWSMLSPRPKLLIVYQPSQEISSEDIKKILVYAWSLEFIDCTVLVIIPTNKLKIFTYNPFTEQLIKDTAKLFPDKLCNLHGYPIKIPSIEIPPYLHVIRNPEGIPIDMSGMSYEYCKILSKTLNFSRTIIPGLENTLILANFAALFDKLNSKEIDMLTLPFNVRSIMYDFNGMLVMGKLFLDTNYVILVPIEPSTKIDIPLDVIIFIPTFFVIICAFQAFKKLFRFPYKHWQANKVFQILLGITVPRKSPKTIVEKFIYLSLVAVSMKYSIEALTKLMDIKLVVGEVEYHHLSDIAESNLPIYTVSFIIEHVYENTDDPVLLKLKENTHDIVNIFECFNEMMVNKSCMCITPHSAGAWVSKKYVKPDGTPAIKVARPILYTDMAAFGYARTSPFAAKFDKVIQRIVESGIANSWVDTQKYTIDSKYYLQRKPIRENVFLQQLYALLSVGYLIASIAFIIEIVCAKSKRRVDKFDKNFALRKLH